MKEFKEWLVKEFIGLLNDEGSPMLRILINIIGSFLILALYIKCDGWIQGLKEEFLNPSVSPFLKVIELTLVIGTTSLIIILIGTSIWSLIKQRMLTLTRIPTLLKKLQKSEKRNGDETDGNPNEPEKGS